MTGLQEIDNTIISIGKKYLMGRYCRRNCVGRGNILYGNFDGYTNQTTLQDQCFRTVYFSVREYVRFREELLERREWYVAETYSGENYLMSNKSVTDNQRRKNVTEGSQRKIF